MKAYIVSNRANGCDNINGIYSLVLETGEGMYSHWCSNKWFAAGDLYRNRKERIEECRQRFGEDLEIIYLGDDEMTMEKLLSLNKIWYKEKTTMG